MKSMRKTALITGITGQDGAYLAHFLLKKGYIVHGLVRRSSTLNTSRIEGIQEGESAERNRFFLHYGDMTDSSNIINVVAKVEPDEIYNLAAQSHVKVSFETPEYTANADAIGSLRLLEAIRILGLEDKTRFYQASTSELYGKVKQIPQTEETPFYPRSPYAAAKLYSYWITINYRQAYNIFAANGILFNHESPLRGENFVTRKISRGVADIALGSTKPLLLGNLDAKRDWGHTKEYVEGMWQILQAQEPDDFVLSTGQTTSVRDFLLKAFSVVGINISFKGKGVDEIGFDEETGQELVRVDPRYFRPTEVDLLVGDSTKAKVTFGWQPKIGIDELIKEMVYFDLYRSKEKNFERDIGITKVESKLHSESGFIDWWENHYMPKNRFNTGLKKSESPSMDV